MNLTWKARMGVLGLSVTGILTLVTSCPQRAQRGQTTAGCPTWASLPPGLSSSENAVKPSGVKLAH